MKQLPLVLFCCLSLKILLVGSTLADSSVLLIIGLLSSFFSHSKSSEYLALEKKLAHLEQIVESSSKEIIANKKDIDDTRALLGGIKLGQQIRSSNANRT